jgi:hypothetical protein
MYVLVSVLHVCMYVCMYGGGNYLIFVHKTAYGTRGYEANICIVVYVQTVGMDQPQARVVNS